MRSLYAAIVVIMLLTLSVSLLAFLAISNNVQQKYLFPVFETMDELQLESALNAWKSGGAPAAAMYLQQLDQRFSSEHYLLDTNGVDVLAGVSRAQLLPPGPATKSRGFVHGQYVVTHRASDGEHWFVAVGARGNSWRAFVPYYLLVLAVVGVLCWLAAVGIVSPIRGITAGVQRFGKGDLSARVELRRHDEIGDLAKSFNEMAAQMQRLMTSERRLLEDISHELRSPLTRLKFAVRLARTESDRSAMLDRVERETDRITSLVSEIVDMTRAEGDKFARKHESVQLDEIVHEAVHDGEMEAAARNCKIQLQGKLSCLLIGDRELLRRAVENVLRNAIRYAPEGTAIEVALAQDAHGAAIRIRDHGPGVPEETLEKIFDPFFRVDESRDAATGGMGLGLSIAQRAVQLHGGTITAENATPGLRVTISLPLQQAATAATGGLDKVKAH